MNKLYRNYETSQALLFEEFKALQIFELLIINRPVIFIQNALNLDSADQIEEYQNKLIIIRDIMGRLVMGKEIQFAQEGNVTYYAMPTNIDELQITTKGIINSNVEYGLVNGVLVASSYETYNNHLNYIINQLVTTTNNTNSATFEWWQSEVTKYENANV
jgi:hypothetical protein